MYMRSEPASRTNEKTKAESKEAIRCAAGTSGACVLHTNHDRRLKCFNHPAAAIACWSALTITLQPACTGTALQTVRSYAM